MSDRVYGYFHAGLVGLLVCALDKGWIGTSDVTTAMWYVLVAVYVAVAMTSLLGEGEAAR